MPERLAEPVVTCSCALFHSTAHGAMGAASTRHSLRPHVSRVTRKASGASAPRECGVTFPQLFENRIDNSTSAVIPAEHPDRRFAPSECRLRESRDPVDTGVACVYWIPDQPCGPSGMTAEVELSIRFSNS